MLSLISKSQTGRNQGLTEAHLEWKRFRDEILIEGRFIRGTIN